MANMIQRMKSDRVCLYTYTWLTACLMLGFCFKAGVLCAEDVIVHCQTFILLMMFFVVVACAAVVTPGAGSGQLHESSPGL